ncbi:hypothetical protein GCM10023081_09640 [Arthrobacter ginkgonis]|uniref:Uncharacterized protein n=1 Tax=Arthrobacter ginkgonis TaxID=1630594 RepID=A0ABP7C199_9MICC
MHRGRLRPAAENQGRDPESCVHPRDFGSRPFWRNIEYLCALRVGTIHLRIRGTRAHDGGEPPSYSARHGSPANASALPPQQFRPYGSACLEVGVSDSRGWTINPFRKAP